METLRENCRLGEGLAAGGYCNLGIALGHVRATRFGVKNQEGGSNLRKSPPKRAKSSKELE
jgi:hypothetical protein